MRVPVLIIALVGLAFAAPPASAQPDRRDHRRPGPGPRPAAISVQDFSPTSGPAGITVTVRGRNLPTDAKVRIGKQTIEPTSATRSSLTFVVPPRVRPGTHQIVIESESTPINVGQFTVERPERPPVAEPVPPATQPPPPVAPPRGRERVPARRTFERPIVTRFGPHKGQTGAKVTIYGERFSPRATVFIGSTEIPKAQVKPNRIVVRIPKNAETGTIVVRDPAARRPLVVGMFEVVPKYDPVAERKRLEEERRKQAQAAWEARQRELAKSEAERRRALQEREEELRRSREARRAEHQARMRAAWEAAFLADEDTQVELALHAERMARLQRMLRLAEAGNEAKLAIRINITIQQENDRHERRMKTLRDSFRI